MLKWLEHCLLREAYGGQGSVEPSRRFTIPQIRIPNRRAGALP